jgi:hypothetical protein
MMAFTDVNKAYSSLNTTNIWFHRQKVNVNEHIIQTVYTNITTDGNKTEQFKNISWSETGKYTIMINIHHYNGHRNG